MWHHSASRTSEHRFTTAKEIYPPKKKKKKSVQPGAFFFLESSLKNTQTDKTSTHLGSEIELLPGFTAFSVFQVHVRNYWHSAACSTCCWTATTRTPGSKEAVRGFNTQPFLPSWGLSVIMRSIMMTMKWGGAGADWFLHFSGGFCRSRHCRVQRDTRALSI